MAIFTTTTTKSPNAVSTIINGEKFYVKKTYEGKVLSLREKNGYDDSDFYALVWDSEKNKPVEIMYATTRAWCYYDKAVVDATEDVVEKYNAHKEKQKQAMRLEKRKAEHDNPELNKKMIVKRSYKEVKKGMVGTVFFIRKRARSTLVGLRTSERKENGKYLDVFWANASQLKNVCSFED